MKMLPRQRRALGLLALAVLASTASGCEGRAKVAPPETEKKFTGPYVAVIDLTRGLPEKDSGGLFDFGPQDRTFDALLRTLEKIPMDKEAKGVFVRFGGELGMARAFELGTALGELRAKGIPVRCHGSSFGNTGILAASLACNHIGVDPAGEVDTVGLAGQVLYFRKLLSDELKLSIDILQVGKFKGAEEPLTRDGPSDEARASLEGVLADLRTSWLDGIKRGRSSAAADAAEDGPHTPPLAVKRGIVDSVGYADDSLKALRESVKAVREKVVFGKGQEAVGDGQELRELLRGIAGTQGKGPVALVRATGSISSGGGSAFGGGDGIREAELSPVLSRLERDDSIKAVVLRIDSPGGSALASDILWHRLMAIRKKKPLVVSVGEMAASGGYYLASTAEVIFADPVSIVGSIGVVGGKIGFGPALERFGVHSEIFPAKPGDKKVAARAGYMSPFVPWDADTRARVLESMQGIYDLFLERVAEGRHLPKNVIADSAEGRIFSGAEGKRRKLVDELGGLSEAVAKARALAKLPNDAEVYVVERPPALLTTLSGDAEAHAPGVEGAPVASVPPLGAAAEAALEDLLRRLTPAMIPYVRSYELLLRGERTLCVLPYALDIR
ncbi:MAG: S49 family peptidase [Polyangiaceae bacterium]